MLSVTALASSSQPVTVSKEVHDRLWQEMLFVDGFNPNLIRADQYGNIIRKDTACDTPLHGVVTLWFPASRGGLPREPNMRIMQCSAARARADRLEPNVAWWELQVSAACCLLHLPDTARAGRSV